MSDSSNSKRYDSVVDMVRDTSDAEYTQAFSKHVDNRRLVKTLAATRASMGLTQADIAFAMGWTRSRVDNLENGVDDDLTLGEVRDYARAIGCCIDISHEAKE